MISYKNMKAFIEVAQSATFAEAAEKLYLSQPALSTSIKNMEEQLGGKLFIRSTRKVELSPEGRIFLPNAKRVLADFDGAIDDVKALFSAQTGSIVISAMPAFAEGQLAQIINGFNNKHANIAIRILDVVMEQAIENVRAGRAELGFVFKPQNIQGLHFTPLFTDEFCLVVPAKHVLATQKTCTLNQMSKFPMVAMNRESSLRMWLDAALNAANCKVNIVSEATQLGTIGQIVSQGLGIAIVPQLCRQQMQNKGLVCVPIKDLRLSKEVGVITLQNAKQQNLKLSTAGQRFYEYLLNVF
ncbi:LysR family transcriptional regulator [Glaciecola petra]|uniref:LysR family transcriptional regulator n=1 Tax=Glaciecola petra TaxID=3075602 RepID=A0ABU2ZP55_9ALTE|nr:LysR family transcriptional regulator [Aestuariibacter sp. P117]MDT0594407.1 LysR family transcriptional regulator [Aestuariibacter sp. P117]